MITPAHSRAARALLNWSQPQLAEASGASISTIRDFETGKRTPIANNLSAIEAAFDREGVELLNHGRPGARLQLPLLAALRAVARHIVANAATHVREGAARPTEAQKAARRSEIEAVGHAIFDLAEDTRSRHVTYGDFEAHLHTLHRLGFFPLDGDVSEVARICHLMDNRAPQAATEADMRASATDVRSKAADAADEAMSGMDATAEEKAGRRRELTDEPAVIGRARGKGRK